MPSGAPISGTSWSTRPARRAPTSGSWSSSASASRSRRSGRRSCWRRCPSSAARRSTTCCIANGQVDRFPLTDIDAGYANDESAAFGFYLQKGLFEEYASFGRHHGHDLAPFDTYHQVRGLRWPVVDGKETRWRYREGLDPYVEAGSGRAVLRLPRQEGADLRLSLRAAGRGARRGVRPLAGHRPRARALAFRLDDRPRARAYKAFPNAVVFMHPDDAAEARPAARRRGRGRIAPRPDPDPGRDPRPRQAAARASCSCPGSTRAS